MYVYRDYSTVGEQAPIQADWELCPFNATVAVSISDAAVYGVQFTLDDVNNPDPVSGVVWFDDQSLPAGSSTNGVSYYSNPVMWIRLVVTAVTGTISIRYLQGAES